jgi:hypothetical protein
MIMLKHRRLMVTAGAAGVFAAAVLALCGPADAAVTSATAIGSCWYMDNTPGETGGCYQSYNQFTEPANLYATAGGGAVDGTGNPGDLLYATAFQQVTNPYHCDNGATTYYWYYGTDQNTGTTGWVADCYLNWEGP